MVRDLSIARFRFFIVLLCGLFTTAVWACPLANPGGYDTVSSVIDGDSVMLVKYGEARLIGINVPEYDQALGSKATGYLDKLLTGKRVSVQFGKEKRDSYGRSLLHLQTNDGVNPASEQLRRGYAFHIVVPPNAFNAECYAAAEREARQENRNIWQEPAYQPHQIKKRHSGGGFQRVKGQIEAIKMKKSGIELTVKDSRLNLFIPKANIALFGGYQAIETWVTADFIVRGWISQRTYKGRNYLSLRLQHPAMIEYIAKGEDELR